MLFSVVIPTFNSERFIISTIVSVLNQSYKDFEIIVSDDGSTDKTIEVVITIFKEYSFNEFAIIANNHLGPGAARNAGISKAKGEWISFLDSDDVWEKNKLSVIHNLISKNDKIDLYCHSEKAILLNKSEVAYDYYKQLDNKVPLFLSFFRQNALSTSAVTVKKRILIEAGLFDDSLPSAQDYDLWLRISLIPGIKIFFIKEYLGYYLLRSDNISSNYTMRYKCLSKIFTRYKERLIEFSDNSYKDRINFLYKINKGYCRNLILDRKIPLAIPYLIKLLLLKILKILSNQLPIKA